MALEFPVSASIGDVYRSGSSATYLWTGTYWQVQGPGATPFRTKGTMRLGSTSKRGQTSWGFPIIRDDKDLFIFGGSDDSRMWGYGQNNTVNGTMGPRCLVSGGFTGSWTKVNTSVSNLHALSDAKVLYSMGDNTYGQCGLATSQSTLRLTPHKSPLLNSYIRTVEDFWSTSQTDRTSKVNSTIVKVYDRVAKTYYYYSWGWNYYNQLGIATGSSRRTDTKYEPEEIINLRGYDIVSMSMGDTDVTTVFALERNGQLFSWGFNQHGATAQRNSVDSYVGFGNAWISSGSTAASASIGSGSGIIDVWTGRCRDASNFFYGSTILKNDGTVYACGFGYLGLNGGGFDLNTARYQFFPVYTNTTTSASLQNITKIYQNGWGRYALDTGSNLWAWGYNDYYHWGIGDNISVYSASIIQSNVKEFWPLTREYLNTGLIWVDNNNQSWAAGYNVSGHLGIGDDYFGTSTRLPRRLALPDEEYVIDVMMGPGFVSSNLGYDYSCNIILTNKGYVYLVGWVLNEFNTGQESGPNAYISTPVRIEELSNYKQV